ncbi:putative disease resistance protein RGA1 [Glycine soja]
MVSWAVGTEVDLETIVLFFRSLVFGFLAMAESFLFSIAESLLSKLASQAYEEASRVLGLYDHLKNLKDTLSLVQAVLLDADQKQEKNHELREWLRQLKRVFFDAENVLDEFECQTLQNQVVKAHDVIGREQDKAEIIELLMQQNPNDDHKSLSVIPIVGMGGLGKTTLAKFVFNDKKIDECFPLKMWNLSKMGLETLQNQLRHKLADQKFLLVLDGVWKEDRVKWVELRNLIHVGAAAGSKILVTTRSHSIASMMGTVSSHILEGLSLEDSLSLFVRWAFNEGEEKKYPRLIKIGREIVKKCRGVPLALRTLGSLLFPKYDTIQWEDVRDNEIWYLPQKKDDILPALKVSYDLMPSYLRQCFALFSLYPKDYKFYSYDVIQLWGALGFLASPKNNRAQDDIAIQYLWELFSRSLLQDFVSHGTYYSFCLHDLVHDLALFVAKDDCLLVNSHIQSIPESIQHLSFVEKDFHGKSLTTKAVGVRTIFYPDAGAEANFKAYKYLRILHLTNSTFETLPPFIGKLKHLRCLNLRNNKKIKRLPDSICKLQNLQFLFLDGCTELETLPKSLRKLISLYNFEITTKQAVLPENEIANLSYLQYLTIGYCDNVESLFSGIEFPVLKALSVWCCKRLKSLPLDSKHFPALETLHVRYCDKLELFKGHEDQNFYSKLKEVGFWEMPQLEILPHWVQGCANTLLSLHLSYCFNLEVLPDWLPMLTNLRVLDIELCPKLRSLPDGMHCLTALEHLRIKDCRELCIKYKPQVGECWDQISHIKQITIDEQEIWMKSEHCPKLWSLPDGMHCLTALEHLQIKDCLELCIKYEPQVGECWDQISHIKQITIDEQNISKKSFFPV